MSTFGSSVVPDLLATMNSVRAEIDVAREILDLLRIGGIEDVKFWKSRRRAEACRQHFGPEARSAHAHEQHVGKILRAHLAGEFL